MNRLLFRALSWMQTTAIVLAIQPAGAQALAPRPAARSSSAPEFTATAMASPAQWFSVLVGLRRDHDVRDAARPAPAQAAERQNEPPSALHNELESAVTHITRQAAVDRVAATPQPPRLRDLSTDFILATWLSKGAVADQGFFGRLFENVPVIFFRDAGKIPTTRDFLKDHITELKAAGVTHFAVDLPPDMKEAVEGLLRNPTSDAFIRDFGAGAFKHVERFLPVLRAARAEGLAIEFIDIPLIFRSSNLEDRFSDRVRQQMAANIVDKTVGRDPLAKVVVLASPAFAKRLSVPAKLRESFGVKSLVVDVPYLYDRFYFRDADVDAVLSSEDEDAPAAVAPKDHRQPAAPVDLLALGQGVPSDWHASTTERFRSAIREGRAQGRLAAVSEFAGLQDGYNKHFRLALESLARLIQATDPQAVEEERDTYLRQAIAVMIYASAIVGMIDTHGNSRLKMTTSDRQYWMNLVGSDQDPKDLPLVRRDLALLSEAFDLGNRPDILARINAPVRFMGFAAYAEFALDLDALTRRLGWSAYQRGHGVLPLFTNLYKTFSNGGASHHTLAIGAQSVRRIFISNSGNDAETSGLIVHEMTHEILDLLHASYLEFEPGESTKSADWFTSALELMSVERAGGLDALLRESDGQFLSSTYYHALAFSRQLAKPIVETPEARAAQIDETVARAMAEMGSHPAWRDYVAGKGRRIHFYIRGGAFGAEALKLARSYATSIGRAHDEKLIYTMAARYIAAGALGGAQQTFADVVRRADAAFSRIAESTAHQGAAATHVTVPAESAPQVHRWIHSKDSVRVASGRTHEDYAAIAERPQDLGLWISDLVGYLLRTLEAEGEHLRRHLPLHSRASARIVKVSA